jgi:hypothetical protein
MDNGRGRKKKGETGKHLQTGVGHSKNRKKIPHTLPQHHCCGQPQQCTKKDCSFLVPAVVVVVVVVVHFKITDIFCLQINQHF